MYQVENIPKKLWIGRQGDNGVTNIEVDCSDWLTLWPTGDIFVSFVPPNGGTMIILPPEQAVVSGNTLTITVLRNMTTVSGEGSINIRLTLGDDIEKRSALITTILENGQL